MNDGRFATLVERYFDRELSADENAELQSLLRENAEARERFWKEAEWQALFRQWGGEESGRQAAEAEPRVVPMPVAPRPAGRAVERPRVVRVNPKKIVRFPFVRWAAGIAAAAAVVMLVLVLRAHGPVATLAHATDAVWQDAAPGTGTRLKPGRLRLEKGAAVIAFDRGARIVLEGPAELSLQDGNQAILHSGKLRARVPESAHGFKIAASGFSVVDLGTEFGCSIAADGVGEVHVIEGTVEMRTAEGPATAKQLNVDEAVRIAGGVTTAIPVQPGAFLSEEKIRQRELRRNGDALGSWRSASRELSAHRSALVHLDFEGGDVRMLPNLARSAFPPGTVAITGCPRTAGRWPGKGALEFRNAGDRLRFAAGGEFDALTLLAWVRVGDLQSRQHLLSPLGEFRNGELDWYFNPDGSLSVGVHLTLESDPARGWSIVKSTPALKAGEWTMVAVVLDRRSRSATHFVNGQPVGSGMLESRVPFRLGEIEIGDSERHPDARRNFRGRIDEFAIFSTAFSAEEIRSIYEDCRP